METLKLKLHLLFAIALVNTRGSVSDSDIKAVKAVGYTDGEVGEIVTHVALNIFTNYLNKTANTAIDFPVINPYVNAKAA